jgi:hypothetical protein
MAACVALTAKVIGLVAEINVFPGVLELVRPSIEAITTPPVLAICTGCNPKLRKDCDRS